MGYSSLCSIQLYHCNMKTLIGEQTCMTEPQYNFMKTSSRSDSAHRPQFADTCSNQSTVSNHPISQSIKHTQMKSPIPSWIPFVYKIKV